MEYNEKDENRALEAVRREKSILKYLETSEYFLKITGSFFLTEGEGEEPIPDEKESYIPDLCPSQDLIEISKERKCYFFQEMELCEGNLNDILDNQRKKAPAFEETVKFHLAIQMLDAVNSLHSRNNAHMNIKPSNFLFKKKDDLIVLKLCDSKFASPHTFNSLRKLTSGMSVSGANTKTSYSSFTGSENTQNKIKYDLFSLGMIFLELDHIHEFDQRKLKAYEFLQA